MSLSNAEIRLYVDTLILEAVLADPTIVKKADTGILENIKNEVTKYVENSIDPDNKTASMLSLLAPVAIFKIFSNILPRPIALILGILSSAFRIDIKDIFAKVYSEISNLISGGKKTTSAAIDNAVRSAVASTVPQPTEEHAKKFIQQYKKEDTSKSEEDIDTDIFSSSSIQKELRHARMLKLALIDYEQSLIKTADTKKSLTGILGKLSSFTGFLTGSIGWIFKIALLAGGFIIAGDVLNRFLDRPSIGEGTIQKGKVVDSSKPQIVVPKSTQTKFPLRKDYTEENYNQGSHTWIVNLTANKPNIENLILDFADDVFQGLENKENLILNNPKFKALVNHFMIFNAGNMGTNITIVPYPLHSKRQVVDMFIDDVAKSA